MTLPTRATPPTEIVWPVASAVRLGGTELYRHSRRYRVVVFPDWLSATIVTLTTPSVEVGVEGRGVRPSSVDSASDTEDTGLRQDQGGRVDW